jgi:hypothetical protein
VTFFTYSIDRLLYRLGVYGPQPFEGIEAGSMLQSAKDGDHHAIMVVTTRFIEGKQIDISKSELIDLLRSAEDGSLRATVMLAALLESDGQFDSAAAEYHKAASDGILVAMYRLGNILCNKLHREREGSFWLETAASAGHMFAKRDLGRIQWQRIGRVRGALWYTRFLLNWSIEFFHLYSKDSRDIRLGA